jgi:DNA-binding IscR family transcriptional regulator
MNHQEVVQYAVLCLRALEDHAGEKLTVKQISRLQGVPVEECQRILGRLCNAGIVELVGPGLVQLAKPVDEITAIELLEAVWAPEEAMPEFRMLVGGTRGYRLETTLRVIAAIGAENEACHD